VRGKRGTIISGIQIWLKGTSSWIALASVSILNGWMRRLYRLRVPGQLADITAHQATDNSMAINSRLWCITYIWHYKLWDQLVNQEDKAYTTRAGSLPNGVKFKLNANGRFTISHLSASTGSSFRVGRLRLPRGLLYIQFSAYHSSVGTGSPRYYSTVQGPQAFGLQALSR
jgi:hypothetical protein